MRQLADFLRWVLPYATACPEPLAESHVLTAARDFCKATRCWRLVDTLTTTDDVPEVICVPQDAMLFEIEAAQFNGMPLERIAYADVSPSEAGLPRAITQAELNSVRLIPHAAGALHLSLFLMPSQHADELPDFLYDVYGEIIADGALAAILEIPGQPYSDLTNAAYRRGRFIQAKDSNFNVSKRGQQRAPVRTRARYF
ncbi:hypothetical protein [Sphingobium yanoikuyae]|uniref:hypothetical protein n=1 Tax=Sphingobium yanoikuyae TaxID=13690 RepID=UPI0013CEC0B6|nr:hypothetical protein [Sphingobium yanoikuyae]